jgi:hypothetical protein
MPFLGIKEIIDQVPMKQKWLWQGRLVSAFGTPMKPTKYKILCSSPGFLSGVVLVQGFLPIFPKERADHKVVCKNVRKEKKLVKGAKN